MKQYRYIVFVLCVSFFSCTDLSEDVYDTIVNENFYQTEEQVMSAAGSVYTEIRNFTNPEGFWGCNEFSADIMMIPTRGQDWYNGGTYQRAHKQTWTTEDFTVSNSWTYLFNNISACNRLLYQFEGIEEKSDALLSAIEEIKALRALYYFFACDMFGNVPLVTSFDVPDGYSPANNSRVEIFDFVEDELLNAIPNLTNAFDQTSYGRFHKWAAYALLAKLYLNAEIYTGTPMWDECIAACDTIINANHYSVSADDYFTNFAINNEGSLDNIFVIVYDEAYTNDWGYMFNHQCWTLHFSGNKAFDVTMGGWNGICGTPSFVESYDPDDVRYSAWLIGPQFTTSGDTIYCSKTSAGVPLDYSISVNSLENAREEDGARIAKFEYKGTTTYTLSNDYPVFRYADILLMKAEAIMRNNGGTATSEAVDLVNQVRSRAFPNDDSKLYTTSTLTLDALLAERGWEFAGEHWRRNDLIRFGVFNSGLWTFKDEASPATRALFPIPEEQMNANSSLVQNPGY